MQDALRLKEVLERLLHVLEIEKDALVGGDTDKVVESLNIKVGILEELEAFDMGKITTSDDLKKLAEGIKNVQETNILLTKQAMDYQENLIKSIVDVSSTSNVYSENGNYDKKQNISLIDQKL